MYILMGMNLSLWANLRTKVVANTSLSKEFTVAFIPDQLVGLG